jgi:hypothetical protein
VRPFSGHLSGRLRCYWGLSELGAVYCPICSPKVRDQEVECSHNVVLGHLRGHMRYLSEQPERA